MLKLQYFGHLMQKSESLEKTLMLGKIEGKRRWQWRTRWLDGNADSRTWVWANSRRWWSTEKSGLLRSMGSHRIGHDYVNNPLQCSRASLVAQMVKILPAMQETWFSPWVGKITWSKAQKLTPVFLPGESPWTEEPGGLQSIGVQRVRRAWNNLACRHSRNIGKMKTQVWRNVLSASRSFLMSHSWPLMREYED